MRHSYWRNPLETDEPRPVWFVTVRLITWMCWNPIESENDLKRNSENSIAKARGSISGHCHHYISVKDTVKLMIKCRHTVKLSFKRRDKWSGDSDLVTAVRCGVKGKGLASSYVSLDLLSVRIQIRRTAQAKSIAWGGWEEWWHRSFCFLFCAY